MRLALTLREANFDPFLPAFGRGILVPSGPFTKPSRRDQDFDIVPQLQANFAFTKAYVAEASGSKGGLEGPNFYVDLILFRDGRPEWLDLGPSIEWSSPKLLLEARFAALLSIREEFRHPTGGPIDILDGLEIAQRLANDPDVLVALRAAGKP